MEAKSEQSEDKVENGTCEENPFRNSRLDELEKEWESYDEVLDQNEKKARRRRQGKFDRDDEEESQKSEEAETAMAGVPLNPVGLVPARVDSDELEKLHEE